MVFPTISVVIPTWNYAAVLPRAIQSALKQTAPPLEIVVVDDGSTDGSAAVAESFGPPVRVLKNCHQGLAASRNAGISASSGELIAFLDADDWWDPNKLEVQLEALLTGVDAVGCGERIVRASDEAVLLERTYPSFGPDWRTNVRGVASRRLWVGGSGSGLLIRRSSLEEIGPFDARLGAAEDWDFWLRLAACASLVNVPHVLTNLWRHGGGVFGDPARMEAARMQVAHLAASRWPDALHPLAQREMRSLIWWDTAGEYEAMNDDRSALRCYLSSLREWPGRGLAWRRAARIQWRLRFGR